jgi:hypothetical protein
MRTSLRLPPNGVAAALAATRMIDCTEDHPWSQCRAAPDDKRMKINYGTLQAVGESKYTSDGSGRFTGEGVARKLMFPLRKMTVLSQNRQLEYS